MSLGSNEKCYNRFMSAFGQLQKLLVEARKYERDYFLTCVDIKEDPTSGNIEVGFGVHYGPVARYAGGYDSVDARMLEFRQVYVFNKSGICVEERHTNLNLRYDFYPHAYSPSPNDFPSPYEDKVDLFGVICRLSASFYDIGKPLNSIQFRTTPPTWEYDYSGGSSDPDCRREFRYMFLTGFCLKSPMLNTYKYVALLQESKTVSGEYDLVFWVKS